jgi:hypothetical protein
MLGWMGDPTFETLSGEGRARASWTVRELKFDMLATSEPVGTTVLSKCETGSIKASLIVVENSRVRLDGMTGTRTDLEAKRRADDARNAEFERVAAEEQANKIAADAAEQAKKDAAAAERRKRQAAEQRKKDAALDARIEKERAAESARAIEERRRVRAACSGIYQNTVDKKVKDLTVGEEQQVRACQVLGLYPPR